MQSQEQPNNSAETNNNSADGSIESSIGIENSIENETVNKVDENPEIREENHAPQSESEAVQEISEDLTESAPTAEIESETTEIQEIAAEAVEESSMNGIQEEVSDKDSGLAQELIEKIEESPVVEAVVEAVESAKEKLEEVVEDVKESISAAVKSDVSNSDSSEEDDEEEIHEDHDEELEDQIAWDELSREELRDKFLACLENVAAKDVRNKVIKIRDAYKKVKDEEIATKKERYLENGGIEEDFETPFDTVDEEFQACNKKFRELRAKIRENKEKELEKNLEMREGLIEELKALLDDANDIPKKFDKLKEIENNWRAIGHVPQLRAEELWKNFRFHRQNFYDLIHINNELRELDQKKNLELKTELCEKAEALMLNDSIRESLDEYKVLHDQWKEIGHVAKDVNESIWERFKAAGDRLYERRREFIESQESVYAENLEKKKAIIEKTKELMTSLPFDAHAKWQEASDLFAAFMEEWKQAGFASRKENEAVWEEFKSLREDFYNQKESFYKDLRNAQNENYKTKVDLCMKAEELKESSDWKKTGEILKDLQEQWKKSGPVAKKHSDKLWKRFRTACDEFFNQRKEHFAEMSGEQEENLKKKEELIAKIQAYEHAEDGNETFEAIKGFQNEWIEIGHVPIKQKDKIQKTCRTAIDAQFAKLKSVTAETRKAAFKAQVQSLGSDKGGKDKLQYQRNVVQEKIKRLQSDVQTLENNIGFFGNSKSKAAEEMKRDIEKKISKAKEEIGQLKDQMKILRES